MVVERHVLLPEPAALRSSLRPLSLGRFLWRVEGRCLCSTSYLRRGDSDQRPGSSRGRANHGTKRWGSMVPNPALSLFAHRRHEIPRHSMCPPSRSPCFEIAPVSISVNLGFRTAPHTAPSSRAQRCHRAGENAYARVYGLVLEYTHAPRERHKRGIQAALHFQ
jgi:hypothetical protein